MAFSRNRNLLRRHVNGRRCGDLDTCLAVDDEMRFGKLWERVIAADGGAANLFVLRRDRVRNIGLVAVRILRFVLLRDLCQRLMQLMRLLEPVSRPAHVLGCT